MRKKRDWGSRKSIRSFRSRCMVASRAMSMTSPTWRVLGQVVLVYFGVGGAAVTAVDTQPGRATFSEMIAFARLASVPCQRLSLDSDSFHTLALRRSCKPTIIYE